jgi:hypothetical protein
MMGVHGNGLSHQLWMEPGSAVLEVGPCHLSLCGADTEQFMNVGGFARVSNRQGCDWPLTEQDYAMLGELMSHEYYAVHKNHVFTPDK